MVLNHIFFNAHGRSIPILGSLCSLWAPCGKQTKTFQLEVEKMLGSWLGELETSLQYSVLQTFSQNRKYNDPPDRVKQISAPLQKMV